MKRSFRVALLIAFAVNPVRAQETAAGAADTASTEIAESAAESRDGEESPPQSVSPAVAGATPDQPKAMSGMSILGNEEAPKALVIIPWKTSELGDDISMQASLDDRAVPVDKEVFLRELSFYEIRKSE